MFVLSIKNKITYAFFIIILASTSILTIATLNLHKEQLTEMMEMQMLDSAQSVVDKISVLEATLDARSRYY